MSGGHVVLWTRSPMTTVITQVQYEHRNFTSDYETVCLKMAMSYCFCCGKSVSDGEEKKRRRLPNMQVCSVLGIEFS